MLEIKEVKNGIEENGFHAINNFLSDKELNLIRDEVEFLFSKNLIHGHGFSVYINPRRQEIPQAPSRIKSINLFEKSLDIMEILQKVDPEKYKNIRLAHMAIYKENKNPEWLRWHSDVRNGELTRCQIVLRGGQEKSGAFVYIPGSNKIDDIPYRPSKEYLLNNKDKMVMMNKPNGTAFIINTDGYHSRVPVETERISIMMDFVDKDYIKNNANDLGSNLVISFHQLTKRILDNINYFKIDINPNAFIANSSDNYRFNQKLGGYYMFILKPLYIIKSFLGKTEDY